MNTGSIGRSMNRMITQLRNPDQMIDAELGGQYGRNIHTNVVGELFYKSKIQPISRL